MQEKKPSSSLSTDIPKVFYSDLTGTLMNKCISCECDLLLNGTHYIIEKALKIYKGYTSYSTIFEYAICLPCADKMKRLISSHSMKNITQFFKKNFDPEFPRKKKFEKNYADIGDLLNNCMVKGTSIEDLSECQIYAQCNGDQMLLSQFPYMVSGAVLDEMIDLLSPETLDDLNRFKNDFVDGPSEFQDLLQSGPKVFL